MKKFLAIVLSITLLFSVMAIPVSAELGDSSTTTITTGTIKSVFERITDVFHDLIANIFKAFGQDCPLCENHDGYGEAGGEGGYNKAEVAEKYNETVNKLKNYKKSLEVEHKRTVEYKYTETKGVTEAVRKAIKNFFEDYKGTYYSTSSFKMSESAKISALIPPSGKEAKLDAKYVDNINRRHISDITVIDFKLTDSVCSFDGTRTTAPEGYGDVINLIALEDLELQSGKITKADISYKDTTVEASYDANGKVKTLKTASEITFDVTFELSGKTSQFTVVVDISNEYSMTY